MSRYGASEPALEPARLARARNYVESGRDSYRGPSRDHRSAAALDVLGGLATVIRAGSVLVTSIGERGREKRKGLTLVNAGEEVVLPAFTTLADSQHP